MKIGRLIQDPQPSALLLRLFRRPFRLDGPPDYDKGDIRKSDPADRQINPKVRQVRQLLIERADDQDSSDGNQGPPRNASMTLARKLPSADLNLKTRQEATITATLKAQHASYQSVGIVGMPQVQNENSSAHRSPDQRPDRWSAQEKPAAQQRSAERQAEESGDRFIGRHRQPPSSASVSMVPE